MIKGLNSAFTAANILSYSTRSSGIDFVGTFGGGSQTASVGGAGITAALAMAEKNESKQVAQTAKDPQVRRDIERYEKVVKSADSIDDVLNDPIARKVLMTAAGLGAYVDQVALAKKAMTSDPADPNSLANKLASTNGAWLQFAKDYNIPKYGLDRLSPQNDGYKGRWRLDLEREGKPIEALLEIKRTTAGAWQATVNGVATPTAITGNTIAMTVFWEDDEKKVHTSHLTGTLGKNGIATGPQSDDGKASTNTWSAEPYFANSIKEVTENYTAEKRLDMLDQQLPGLGTAMLFMKSAGSLDTPIKILGNALGREVVTTALGLPKQLALQSLEAQVKAVEQRIDPAKLKNAEYARKMAVRYLVVLNGGTTGVTA